MRIITTRCDRARRKGGVYTRFGFFIDGPNEAWLLSPYVCLCCCAKNLRAFFVVLL